MNKNHKILFKIKISIQMFGEFKIGVCRLHNDQNGDKI